MHERDLACGQRLDQRAVGGLGVAVGLALLASVTGEADARAIGTNTLITASTISTAKRMRFSMLPPYSSVRWLELSRVNCSIR